jgi:hypothetical protein
VDAMLSESSNFNNSASVCGSSVTLITRCITARTMRISSHSSLDREGDGGWVVVMVACSFIESLFYYYGLIKAQAPLPGKLLFCGAFCAQ